MPITRKERTARYTARVEHAWLDIWWKWILDHQPNTHLQDKHTKYWKQVSACHNVSMKLVLDNPDKKWDWSALSSNIGISLADISANSNKPWDWNEISDRSDMTLEFFRQNLDKPLDIAVLSCNQSPEIELILCEFPDLDWQYGLMGELDGFSYLDIHIETVLKLKDKPWDWDELTCINRGISIDDILNHPELPWSFYGIIRERMDLSIAAINKLTEVYPDLSTKYYITPEKLINNSYIPWDDLMELLKNPKYTTLYSHCDKIANNVNVTIERIIYLLDKYPELNDSKLFWQCLSMNPAIKASDVAKYPDKPWYWFSISKKQDVTMNMVLSLPYKPWDWDMLSCIHGITLSDILMNQNKHHLWDWHRVFNIKRQYHTMKFIEEYVPKFENLPEYRDMYLYYANDFKDDSIEFKLKSYRAYLAAYRIQQWWQCIRLDPRHPVGQRRLEREYEDLAITLKLKVYESSDSKNS